MADKPYREMTPAELQAAFQLWRHNVETAAGWSSAYFAAKQLEQICEIGGFDNPHPIIFGEPHA